MPAFSVSLAEIQDARARVHPIIQAVPLGAHAVAPLVAELMTLTLDGLQLDTPEGQEELVRRCTALVWGAGEEACIGAVRLATAATISARREMENGRRRP